MQIKSRRSGIYEIVCTSTNKKYVGSTSAAFNIRCRQHKSLLKLNKHHSIKLQNAWNKYGELSFQFNILQICTEDELTVRKIEKEWLDKFDTYKNGYNMSEFTEGLLGVKRLSGEKCHQAKLNTTSILEAKKQYEEGKSLSEIARYFNVSDFAIGQALKGRTYKEVGLSPMVIRKTYYGETYSNLKEEQAIEIVTRGQKGEAPKVLALEFGVSVSTIRNLINGVSWPHLKIDRKNRTKDGILIKERKKILTPTQLLEIDKQLNLKKESQRNLAKIFGVTEQTISSIKTRKGSYQKKFKELGLNK